MTASRPLLTIYSHAPWNTTEYFANNECLYIGSEEKDEDETRHGDQGANHRLAVAVTLANEAVDEQTNDLSGTGTIRPRTSYQLNRGILLSKSLTTRSASSVGLPTSQSFH